MAQSGWEGATVAAVAERAGVAVGSVYRRFADKEALFVAVFEAYYAASYERRARRLAGGSGLDDLQKAARFVLGELVARTRENAPFLRSYWSAATPRDPALRKRIDAANAKGFEQIAEFLTARAGNASRDAVRFGLQCAAHAIRGRYLYPAAQPLDVPLSDSAFTAQLVHLLVAYVRGRSGRRH